MYCSNVFLTSVGSNILTDLAKCLGQGLKTLRLYDCGYITMTDIEAIFRSLLNNTTLKELIIWVTSIELSTASKVWKYGKYDTLVFFHCTCTELIFGMISLEHL